MSPPRRRSARLASASKSRALPPPATLTSVAENDEPPCSPSLPRPLPREPRTSPIWRLKHQPSTPSNSIAKPPASEMHPSKIQRPSIQPSSAVKHGFRDLIPTTRSEQLLAAAQATPTKIRDMPSQTVGVSAVPTLPFTFSIKRPAMDKGLSNEAQKIMEDLREEAAAIKAQLVADREREIEEEKVAHDRKIAQPKGKGNRYSAAHIAEFRKMDSIENHPSAFRAAPGRFMPVKTLKRKSSKANLDEPPTSNFRASTLKRSPSKASLSEESTAPSTPCKIPGAAASRSGISSVKRLRQKLEDDAATTRPASRDGSSIPRPMTAFDSPSKAQPNFGAKFGTPSKSGIARPAESTIRIVKTPTKSELPPQQKDGDVFKASVSRSTFAMTAPEEVSASPMTASKRFDQLKSILKKSSASSTSSSISDSTLPVPPSLSKTPAPTRTTEKLDAASRGMTTPNHRLSKHSASTPHLKTITPTSHVSPSFKSAMKKVRMFAPGDKYPSMSEALNKAEAALEIKYPDLSKFSGLSDEDINADNADDVSMVDAEASTDCPAEPAAVPGTFSFRSDKTIDFGVSKPDFGAGIGQASIRQVRQSVFGGLPGAFPKSKSEEDDATTGTGVVGEPCSDKENSNPPRPVSSDGKYQAIYHGIGNKKRHRASTDEEDETRNADERANKKRRNGNVPNGISVKTPVKSAPTTTARSAPGPTRHFSTDVKPKPKTPSATRTIPATVSKTPAPTPGRTPGYATATSAVKNKELLTRKIKQPVRPTDKLKAATNAPASRATAPTAASSNAAAASRTPGRTTGGIPKPLGMSTPRAGSRVAPPASAARVAATPSQVKTPGVSMSPVKPQVRATPSISASRLAQLAAPKRR